MSTVGVRLWEAYTACDAFGEAAALQRLDHAVGVDAAPHAAIVDSVFAAAGVNDRTDLVTCQLAAATQHPHHGALRNAKLLVKRLCLVAE